MDHVLLLDMAIHSFDSARQILGDPDPAWVQAYEWNPSGSRYRHGANAVATFGFANGAVFSYQGTWTASGVQTDWCCDWRIQASAGAAQLSRDLGMRVERLRDPDEPSAADGGPLIRSLDPLPVPTHEDGPNVRNGHNEAIADFVTAIRHERKPRCHAAENIKSLAMVHAAVEAAESGRREVVSW
jgi:predicted dehydrogenase